ncbi:histidinol dehydrogenase [Cryomorphaceae bacterium 1068]|nr:histidinol dehydrogenase [Cryomorphaceae bacterium 1068]
MKTVKFPAKEQWNELIQRPDFENDRIKESVEEILAEVKNGGDAAVLNFTRRFDDADLDGIKINLEADTDDLSEDLKAAINLAIENIERFHRAQTDEVEKIETAPGVTCWRKSLPIEKVGLYVPGGTAPLLSSLMMLGVPAKLAGCREIIVCTPPNRDGSIHPAIRYIARKLDLKVIYRMGGAQAIAAMAYGTLTVAKVDKIFGPGNRFVTLAKQLVQQEGTAIDMPAGPSEVLVIANAESNAAFVAADLLSQAEHGADSQVVLVMSEERGDASEKLGGILEEVESQVSVLPRQEVARKALQNSLAVIMKSDQEAMNFSNRYAPEHLILSTENARELAEMVETAGSVFIGKWSCESLGDYASGTNHTLPTNGFARSYSGVSLDSFVKKVTFQEVTREGLENIGREVELLAEAEGLQAHKNAVSLRLK